MRRRAAIAFALLCAAPAFPQDPADDPCRRMLNERIGQCANEEMGRPGRNPSDFGFWQTCRAKHEPEYQRCLQASNRSSQPSGGLATSDPENPKRPMNEAIFTFPQKGTSPAQKGKKAPAELAEEETNTVARPTRRCPWPEAQQNIDWVMSRDGGAQRTFMQARERGLSCYQSVLAAQGHNGHAQSTIRACGAQSVRYIEAQALCQERVASRPEKPSVDDDTCVGPPRHRYGTMRDCPNSMETTVVNRCQVMKDINICLESNRGPWGCRPFFNVAPGQGGTYAICDASRRHNIQVGRGRFQTPLY